MISPAEQIYEIDCMIDDFIKNNSSYNNKKYGRIKQREQLRY